LPTLIGRFCDFVHKYKSRFKTKTKSLYPQAVNYLEGLVYADKRNMERMCEVPTSLEYHQIQHFISESPWDAADLMEQVGSDVSSTFHGHEKVGLLIDESAHVKKGEKSVGVAKQYCGRLGKVENCQVGVYAFLSSQKHASMVDYRLFLPEQWCEDEKRCRKAGVPEDKMVFKTKLQLALEMVRSQRAAGIRFDWVGADGLYGHDYDFQKALDQDGELFVLDVHSNQGIYLDEPQVAVPEKQGQRGRKPTRLKSNLSAEEVREYAKTLSATAWTKLTIRNTTKGKLKAQVHVRQVYTWNGQDLQAAKRLLIIRKTKSKNGSIQLKYSLSNAPAGTDIKELAKMQSQRYFIERGFQDAKSEIGMSEYQVRGWLAWHHHVAIVAMALLFILTEKVLQKQQMPMLSIRDVRQMLVLQLAKQINTEEQLMQIITNRHRVRQKQINWHKKKEYYS